MQIINNFEIKFKHKIPKQLFEERVVRTSTPEKRVAKCSDCIISTFHIFAPVVFYVNESESKNRQNVW